MTSTTSLLRRLQDTWSEAVAVHQHSWPGRVALYRCSLRETAIHSGQAASSLRSAVLWSLRALQTSTILMVHQCLVKTVLAAGYQSRTEIAALLSPELAADGTQTPPPETPNVEVEALAAGKSPRTTG